MGPSLFDDLDAGGGSLEPIRIALLNPFETPENLQFMKHEYVKMVEQYIFRTRSCHYKPLACSGLFRPQYQQMVDTIDVDMVMPFARKSLSNCLIHLFHQALSLGRRLRSPGSTIPQKFETYINRFRDFIKSHP